MTAEPDAVRENVKARYAEAARAVSAGEGRGAAPARVARPWKSAA